MKLVDYICQLQTLLRKFGDIDIKHCTTYEFENWENREEFDEPFKPYYNKFNKCIIVHEEFVKVDEVKD